MVDGGVEELVLRQFGLCALPAEVRRLSARLLDLCNNKLMSLPAEIEQLIADAVGPRLQSADEFAEFGSSLSLKRAPRRNKLTLQRLHIYEQ